MGRWAINREEKRLQKNDGGCIGSTPYSMNVVAWNDLSSMGFCGLFQPSMDCVSLLELRAFRHMHKKTK